MNANTPEPELTPESETEELARLRAIEARVREELARYGIVHADDPLRIGAGGVEGLLRHVYNNRDATYGAQNLTIGILNGQRGELQRALIAVLAGHGESDATATVETLLRNAPEFPLRGRGEAAAAAQELPEQALQALAMLLATVQGTLVLGKYDSDRCRLIWAKLSLAVEDWLARSRPAAPAENPSTLTTA
jgi:hypothetical protein